MTISGTVHDQLTPLEIGELLDAGVITLHDLTPQQISDWVLWEPPPADLTTFVLSNAGHRQEFLFQYVAQGEPARFTAVSHIWDSLAEPRELRCTLIGAACGVGGKGKMALVLMLDKMLHQCLFDDGPMPRSDQFEDLDSWHQATMAYFSGDEQRMRDLCAYYADILNGSSTGPVATPEGKLIVGPWLPGDTPVNSPAE